MMVIQILFICRSVCVEILSKKKGKPSYPSKVLLMTTLFLLTKSIVIIINHLAGSTKLEATGKTN